MLKFLLKQLKLAEIVIWLREDFMIELGQRNRLCIEK